MAVSPQDVQNLRKMTDAGFIDCKKALEECGGDLEKACDFLRKAGLAKANKKLDRNAGEGRIFSYVHSNQKIGVLVELFSETDFVAKTDAFQQLGRDIAMHIAATNPLAVDRTDFPSDVVAKEKEIFIEQVKALGKPDNVVEKIVEGKVDKFYQDNCLLEQPFVKDPSMSVDVLIKHLIGKVGENIRVGSFRRFQIGS